MKMYKAVCSALFLQLLLLPVFEVTVTGAEQKDKNEPVRIESEETLPGTDLLSPDIYLPDFLIGKQMDMFISGELENAINVRNEKWRFDGSSREEFETFLAEKRENFRTMIGIKDARVAPSEPRMPIDEQGTNDDKPYRMATVRWSVFKDYNAEGVLIDPKNQNPTQIVVVIPHAGMAAADFFKHVPYLEKLVTEKGARVIIPTIVGREQTPTPNGRPTLSARHLIHWTAYELGRTMTGYEVQSVLAIVDWVKATDALATLPLCVAGYGDGGLLALYAGAIDTRIDSVFLAGYFNKRDNLWQEPIDHNVFGLLNEFGDAELAALVYPRSLYIESGRGPEFEIKYPPAQMHTPDPADVQKEMDRAKSLIPDSFDKRDWIQLVTEEKKAELGSYTPDVDFTSAESPEYQACQKRMVEQLDSHNQELLNMSHMVRSKFMSKLDFSSLENYNKSTQWYRDYYYEKVIGKFDKEFVPFNTKSRKTYDEKEYVGYDVLIDVFPGLSAGGVLLIPKDMKPDEKRPVVVFQHGLSGIFEAGFRGGGYRYIAPHLAKEGYVVLAMQGMARSPMFRVPGGRKANCVGKSLFSFIIPQHEQMLKWLRTLPYVKGDKIGLYGISYGGRTAVRVPSVVQDYTLSISSSDFTNWAIRCASSRESYSYVGTGEYESNEFDMANTFSHAELVSLIAPRPFMVERGYGDLCGDAQNVGSEYAKVRLLYEYNLKIPERTRIEWHTGGHEIRAIGTFEFLKQYLCN
ncbi:MAG: hypothetical protein Q4G68_02525 [Planctomycetia bacterium]|nr:hypothetical protein [Planctomycetia bacterium]